MRNVTRGVERAKRSCYIGYVEGYVKNVHRGSVANPEKHITATSIYIYRAHDSLNTKHAATKGFWLRGLTLA